MKQRMFSVILLGILAQLARAADDSAIIEKTLSSVVTVAVYKADTHGRPYGFGADDAYARVLDLSGTAGTGSGFVVEYDGKKYVVTCNHVVQNAMEDPEALVVYSINQTRYPMKLVGADTFWDIAVLAFTGEPGAEVSTVAIADADPRVGQRVYALGTPLGMYPMSVSDGIIGGKNRVLGGLTGRFGYLQSTATIIWGNSGGPLINDKGEVVGMNTQLFFANGAGGAQHIQSQINFALESQVIARSIVDFIEHGRIVRSYFGIEISEMHTLVNGPNNEVLVGPGEAPVIQAIRADSPASTALAGREGWRIDKVNGTVIRNIEEVLGALEYIAPGEQVTMELSKSGRSENAVFKTAPLELATLEQIAKEFLHSNRVEIGDKEGALQIWDTPSSEPAQRMAAFDFKKLKQGMKKLREPEQGQEAEPAPPVQPVQPVEPAKVPLIAAGIADAQGQGTWWRIKTLADLGIICRIASLEGRVDMAIQRTDGSVGVARMYLTTEEAKHNKVLIY